MRATILLVVPLASCSIPDFVYPPGPPVIERFEVTPFEIAAGQITSVEWRVLGSNSVELLGAGEPIAVDAEGSRPLMLDRTARLELIATGEGGTSRAVAEARVVELAEVEITRFEVTPSLVEPFDPVRVVWRTEHASRVVVRLSSGQTLIDHAPRAGALIFRPEHDVTVQLIAEGWPEPKSAIHTVRADPDGPAIVFFQAHPMIAAVEEDITLEWIVANTTRIRILEQIGTSSVVLFEQLQSETDGFFTLYPEAGRHTYLLEASNEVGNVVESTTAFIIPETPPEIVEFTATPTISGPGGDVVLRYRTRFSDRVELWTNGSLIFVGETQSGLHVDRGIRSESISYELVAENRLLHSRTEVRTAVVADELPQIVQLSVDPLEVTPLGDFANPGDPVSVRWSVENTDRITVATDAGQILHTDTDPAGFFDFVPSRDLSIVFSAENSAGRTLGHRLVRVLGPPRVVDFRSDTLVARINRPVTFSWTTEFAEQASFSYETLEPVPVSGSVRQYTLFMGDSFASLDLTNDRARTSTTIRISVIGPGNGPFEIEPNDREPLGGGPYFTFPGSVRGEVTGSDVDMFELVPALFDRISLDTSLVGGCGEGVALELYEASRTDGLLGPRLVIDRPSLCATADPITTPILASLEPPIWVAIRRPTGTSNITPSPYLLSFSSQDGFCSDGIVDLDEECDDTNLVENDGCNADCRWEGLDETEPNDVSPSIIAIDTAVHAYLSHGDVDLFRFEIDATDAGQRSILLESPSSGSCDLDATLTLGNEFGVVLATEDNEGLGCPMLAGSSMILTQGVYHLEVRPGRGIALPRKGRYVFSVR